MPEEGFTIYTMVWWLNQIAQPLAIIGAVVIWAIGYIRDRRHK